MLQNLMSVIKFGVPGVWSAWSFSFLPIDVKMASISFASTIIDNRNREFLCPCFKLLTKLSILHKN